MKLNFLAVLAAAFICTGCNSDPNSNEAPESRLADCGYNDGQMCETVIVDGQTCVIRLCGNNNCIYCPEPQHNNTTENEFARISPSSLIVSELNQSGLVSIQILKAPTSDVTITVSAEDTTELTLDQTQFVVTPDNWQERIKLLVSGVEDNEADGDTITTLTFTFTSSDATYNNLSPLSLNVTCIDDGKQNNSLVSLRQYSALTTSEDGTQTAEIGLRLQKQPTSDVEIQLTSSDITEGLPEPSTLTFTPSNFDQEQRVFIHGVDDDDSDGPQKYKLSFKIVSSDPQYASQTLEPLSLTNLDNDESYPSGKYKIRLMAANITSGSAQSYDAGHGIRIFQALKPDIILIQEFNYGDNSSNALRTFVDTAFGEEYYYYRGSGTIPNGIISRYKIIETGGWDSNIVENRRWEWAVIDIPGPRDLLAVSLHLHTEDNASEMRPLMTRIQAKLTEDQTTYYLAAGGDFNTKNRTGTESKFSSLFTANAPYPVDQNNNDATSSARTNPYDWLLFSPELDKLEVPVVIGKHSYASGHVFDSRIYYKACNAHTGVNELSDVSPVLAADSKATGMQHMPVIRDIEIVIK